MLVVALRGDLIGAMRDFFALVGAAVAFRGARGVDAAIAFSSRRRSATVSSTGYESAEARSVGSPGPRS